MCEMGERREGVVSGALLAQDMILTLNNYPVETALAWAALGRGLGLGLGLAVALALCSWRLLSVCNFLLEFAASKRNGSPAVVRNSKKYTAERGEYIANDDCN